jgi:hypothetical protein
MNCSEIEFGGMTIDEEEEEDTDEAGCAATDSASEHGGVAIDEPDEETEAATGFSWPSSELEDSDANDLTAVFDFFASGSFT